MIGQKMREKARRQGQQECEERSKRGEGSEEERKIVKENG